MNPILKRRGPRSNLCVSLSRDFNNTYVMMVQNAYTSRVTLSFYSSWIGIFCVVFSLFAVTLHTSSSFLHSLALLVLGLLPRHQWRRQQQQRGAPLTRRVRGSPTNTRQWHRGLAMLPSSHCCTVASTSSSTATTLDSVVAPMREAVSARDIGLPVRPCQFVTLSPHQSYAIAASSRLRSLFHPERSYVYLILCLTIFSSLFSFDSFSSFLSFVLLLSLRST